MQHLTINQAAYADTLSTAYHQGRSHALRQLLELKAISPGPHTFRSEIHAHRAAQVQAHESGQEIIAQYHAGVLDVLRAYSTSVGCSRPGITGLPA